MRSRSQICQLRLIKEVEILKKYNPKEQKNFQILKFNEHSIFTQRVLIFLIHGPYNSPYYGYSFRLYCQITEDYPLVPPEIRFLDIPWNPFIDIDSGKICVDILKAKTWDPSFRLESLILSLIFFLCESKLEIGMSVNLQASEQMQKGYPYFCQIVKQKSKLNSYNRSVQFKSLKNPLNQNKHKRSIKLSERSKKLEEMVTEDWQKQIKFFLEHQQLQNQEATNNVKYLIRPQQISFNERKVSFQIFGPPNTPYSGYSFRLYFKIPKLKCKDQLKKINIYFVDKPWSPFINWQTGRMILKIGKSYQLELSKILSTIINFLSLDIIPPNNQIMNKAAANDMKTLGNKFSEIARRNAEISNRQVLTSFLMLEIYGNFQEDLLFMVVDLILLKQEYPDQQNFQNYNQDQILNVALE